MSNPSGIITISSRRVIAVLLVLLLAFQCSVTCALKAEAAGGWNVIVTGSTVNIRSGAGTSYKVLGTASCGSRYSYISEKNGTDGRKWYCIRYKSSQKGWITSQYSAKLKKDAAPKDIVNKLAASYRAVGMQVALINNGKVTETYNYGYAVKNVRKMTSNDKIRVASLSKVFVAMNIMKLSEQGKVNINKNISSYWGAKLPKAVTLKSLLSHTSTLYDLSYNSTKSGTLSQLMKSGNYRSGTVGSSSVWAYNNYGVGIAGSTAEAAINKPLDKYAHSAFLNSLSIDASFRSGSVQKKRYAVPYYPDGSVALSVSKLKSIKVSGTPGNNTASFAGGLTITAKDYAKLLAVLVNDGSYGGKRYLSAKSVAAIEKPLFKTSEHGGSFYQCMPLRYKKNLYGQSKLYYHTGNAYGVLALASYNPDTRNGVVVISTGASQTRDSQGVYGVCSVITQNLYEYMDNNCNTAGSAALSQKSVRTDIDATHTLTVTSRRAGPADAAVWPSAGESAMVSRKGIFTVTVHGTTYINAKYDG